MLMSNGSIAPVSLADSSPSISNANYYPNTALPLVGHSVAYGEIYKRQVWVATLVNKVAYGGARLPLKVFTRTADGRDDARDTPYGRLIRQPNRKHDAFFFWLWTISTFEVYGEALWIKIRNRPGAAPVELWPMHPSNVITRRNDDGTMTYVYHAGSSPNGLLEFPEDDVVHFRSYNPDNQSRGLSRLEPLRSTLLNEDAARRATTSFWTNGARPGMLLSHPSNLSQGAQDRLRAQFDERNAGADNYGRTAILEEGMTPHTVSLSSEEAQYIQTRQINREEACGVYDVPPPVVHILDRATFSNITEQMRSMYRDTMAPRLGLYEAVLDSQLRPEFDPSGVQYAEFLMDEVLRGSFEERAAAYKTMSEIAGLTPAEIRKMENRPDLGEDTHRLYISSGMIPLGAAAGANATGQEVKPQSMKALTQDTVDSVMGKLSRATDIKALDLTHLTNGLNGATATVLALVGESLCAGDDIPALRERIRIAAKEHA